MKNKFSFISIIVGLMLTILGCGTSTSGVQVSTATPAGNKSVEDAVATTMAGLKPEETREPVEVPTEVVLEPTIAAIGSARSNPAPVGSEVIADDMKFMVKSIVRPADQKVAEGNMFNATPEANKEYMFVEIQVTCTKTPDEKCTFSSYDVKALGSSGVLLENEMFMAGVSGLIESKEFFGGATMSGFVPFIVDKGDSPLLVYDPMFSFTGQEFYLSLSTQ
jgi:hypothetical protein